MFPFASLGLSNSIRLAIAICDHLDSSSGCLAPLKDPKDPVPKTSSTSLVVQTKYAGLSCDPVDHLICITIVTILHVSTYFWTRF